MADIACMKEFKDAASRVATHTRFRAIGIEHAHPVVGYLRIHQHHKAVATDTEMTVADLAGE